MERIITHLSLFSGIGGLDLAAELAGIKTVGQCEWADYPAKVLEKHWPGVSRWKDIRTLTGEGFYERTGLRTVDVVSGGFPCQPFSVAGKQRGKEDDRFLWPEMVRVVEELRPAWVVGENVAGIVRLALSDILSDLESCGGGYDTRAFLIPACGVGARHRRYRVAIVGHAKHDGPSAAEKPWGVGAADEGGEEGQETTVELKGAGASRNGQGMGGAGYMENAGRGRCGKPENVCEQPGRAEFKRTGEIMANPDGQGLQGRDGEKLREHPGEWKFREGGASGTVRWGRDAESALGGVAHGAAGRLDGGLDFYINHYWDEEPEIPRTAPQAENRADRIKCLGNAVVPQQFYPIFKAIAGIEKDAAARKQEAGGGRR